LQSKDYETSFLISDNLQNITTVVPIDIIIDEIYVRNLERKGAASISFKEKNGWNFIIFKEESQHNINDLSLMWQNIEVDKLLTNINSSTLEKKEKEKM
jgi:hypothetical protein